jgi:tetratricopeptide (TPR) repeat protein/DNA-binding beta-propeller fold protein YncE
MLVAFIVTVCAAHSEAAPRVKKLLGSLGAPGQTEGNNSIDRPTGLAVFSGKVFAVETEENRIRVFYEKLNGIAEWQTDESAELDEPYHLAISENGEVYVSDTGNDRIAVFNTTGTFLFSFGGSGSAPGQLDEPRGIVVSSMGRVYVADSGNSRISVFSLDGIFITSFRGDVEEDEQLDSPGALALSPGGRLYIVDEGANRVWQADCEGRFIRSVGAGGELYQDIVRPRAVAASPSGMVAIYNEEGGKVHLFTSELEKLGDFFSEGSRQGQLEGVRDLKMPTDDNLLLADSGNNRLQLWKIDYDQEIIAEGVVAPSLYRVKKGDSPEVAANTVAAIGKGAVYVYADEEHTLYQYSDGNVFRTQRKYNVKSEPGYVKRSGDMIYIEAIRRIYISDRSLDRIAVVDEKGKPVFFIGSSGSDDGEFDDPRGLATTAGGQGIYVADSGNGRIERFSQDGVFEMALGEGTLETPVDIGILPDGNLAVLDTDLAQIVVLDAGEGEAIRVIGGPDTDLDFSDAISMVVDDTGLIYVLSKNPHRIDFINSAGLLLGKFGQKGSTAHSFSNPTDLSIVNYETIEIAVADQDTGFVSRFFLDPAPEIVDNVKVIHDELETRLVWRLQPYYFIKGYKIYRVLPGSKYELFAETENSYYQLSDQQLSQAAGGSSAEFMVRAESFSGLIGPPGPVAVGYYARGMVALRNGDYTSAATDLLEATKRNIEYIPAHVALARAFMEGNEEWRAREVLENLIDVPGGEAEGYYRLGLLDLATEPSNVEDATEAFEDAISADQLFVPAYSELIDLLLKGGRTKAALDLMLGSIEKLENIGEAHALMGRCYHAMRLYGKSAASFQTALQIEPNDDEIHESFGLMLKDRGDLKAAIGELSAALDLNRSRALLYIELGDLYLQLGQFDRAESLIRPALELEEGNAMALALKGRVALARNDYEEAELSLQLARDRSPGDPAILIDLARAQLANGKGEQAMTTAIAATALVESADVYAELGRICAKLDRLEQATDAFNQAVELDPGRHETLTALGDVLIRSGANPEAEDAYTAALKLNPLSVDALLGRAKVKLNRGDLIGAEKDLIRAVEQAGTNDLVFFYLGETQKQSGDLDGAELSFQTATFLLPSNAIYHNSLGEIYFSRKQYGLARQSFELALKNARQTDPIQKITENLNKTKKAIGRVALGGGPEISVGRVALVNIYPALVATYGLTGIGEIEILNNTAKDINDVTVSLIVPGMMDTPYEQTISSLLPGTHKISLKPVFNSSLLKVTEKNIAIGRITIAGSGRESISLIKNVPLTIYPRTAISWITPGMVGAFVTVNDSPVAEFTRTAFIGLPENEELDSNIYSSIVAYSALRSIGTRYLPDPAGSYNIDSRSKPLDYIQFPRETLSRRSGDCDDLTIVYAAMLFNIGIPVKIADIPGHVLPVVKTKLSKADAARLAGSNSMMFHHEKDGSIWIPIEITMIGKPFMQAWFRGAENLQTARENGKLNLIDVETAWEKYPPVSLPDSEIEQPKVVHPKLVALVTEELSLQQMSALESETRPYLEKIAKNGNDLASRMQLGIAYAKHGLFEKAREQFNYILSKTPSNVGARLNLGNINYLLENYSDAETDYRKALKIDSDTSAIHLNLALVLYKMSKIKEAREEFTSAEKSDPQMTRQYRYLRSLLIR